MSKPVIVPYDGSEFSKRAFPMAVEIARRAAAPLHLVRVHLFSAPALEPQIQPPYGPDFLTELIAFERSDLENVAAEIRQQGVEVVTAFLTAGLVISLLRDYIAEQQARCVVLTTHGRGGFSRAWLGSVGTGLVRASEAPVVMIPITESEEVTPSAISHIVIALDGSPRAEQILAPALELARLFSARITLLSIVPATRVGTGFHPMANITGDVERTRAALEMTRAYLSVVAERHRGGPAIDIEAREDWQNPAVAIVAAAQDVQADLIALATHGRGAFGRVLIGSVADKVIRSRSMPILVWNGPEE